MSNTGEPAQFDWKKLQDQAVDYHLKYATPALMKEEDATVFEKFLEAVETEARDQGFRDPKDKALRVITLCLICY